MSFGLARGRQLDTTGVGIESADLPPFDREPIIDPRAWFGDRAALPLEIEIGSGKGTFLVQEAPQRPQVNFLGIEWAGEFFRYAADRIRRNAIANVRLLHADAIEFIHYRCPDAIAAVIHLYFPDPWPKKRHHKRRLLGLQQGPATVRHLARVVEPGGHLAIATDHTGYAEVIMQVMRGAEGFEREETFYSQSLFADGELPLTEFERKYRLEGRLRHRFSWRRR